MAAGRAARAVVGNREGLKPEPGEVSEAYLDGIATSVDDIRDGRERADGCWAPRPELKLG